MKSYTIPDLARPQLPGTPISGAPLRPPRRSLLPAFLLLVLCPLAFSQTPTPLPPPPTTPPPVQPASPAVVQRITSAKTVFLSNAGANNYFNDQITGGPNVAYNELYAALQQWGYFQLVDSPAHADLIFQIRGTELAPELVNSITGHVIAQQYAAQLELAIFDPLATNPSTPIDTLTTLAGRGGNIPKGTVAFAQSIEWLTYQISTRVSAPRSNPGKLLSRDTLRPSFESLIHFEAPIPPQVLTAKTITVVDDTAPTPDHKPDHSFQAFLTALNTWEYYHLADSTQSADVVFHYHHDEANGVSVNIEDPATKTILWTITDPHYGFYHQEGARRVSALNQNLITLLKQLNHVPLTQTETAALH